MSIPLHCPECGELVGEDDSLFAGFPKFHVDSSIARISCPGEGKHQPPVKTTERKFFGLVERVIMKYPETKTSSSWDEYTGPMRPFYVWLALVLTNDKCIVVNGKWCWWDSKRGFYGDGAKEFRSS